MRCPRLNELPSPPAGKTGWPWTAESAALPEMQSEGSAWPLISVVTPSFNQGDFLEATIRSVLLQGYPNLEYIVIDGGSSDNSVDVIRKYEPWIKYWVSEKDGGRVDGVDRGLQKTHGEIMAWLSSDDMYLPDAFAKVTAVFRDVPWLEWVTTSVPMYWNIKDELVGVARADGYTRNWYYRGCHMTNFKNRKRGKNTVQQESTFWKRPLWERAGARMDVSLKVMGDYELWARFWSHADLAMIEAPIAGFRYHPLSGSMDLETCHMAADEIIAPYRSLTIQNPLVLWLLECLVNWTGRGRTRFGSRLLRVHYDHANGTWVCNTHHRI